MVKEHCQFSCNTFCLELSLFNSHKLHSFDIYNIEPRGLFLTNMDSQKKVNLISLQQQQRLKKKTPTFKASFQNFFF